MVEIAGFRVASLGGIFAGRIWLPGEMPKWQDKRHWLKCQPRNVKKIPLHIDNAIWHHEFEAMKKTVRADILITHEAPSSHQYGFSAIDDLAKAIGAKHIFHGHHHTHYHKQLNSDIAVTGAAIGGVVNLSGEQLMLR